MVIEQSLRQARYERACWWIRHGVEVVPLKPQSKELQPGYGVRKAHIADADFARKWFLNTDANIGIVLGGSARLIVADWDDSQQYEIWRVTASTRIETLTERTARGYHLFFACEGLATAVGNGCEIKTSGVCMVSPSVHPSGVVYRVLDDIPITEIDLEQACGLFPFLSERSCKPRSEGYKRSSVRNAKRRNDMPLLDGVVTRIKVARPILDEMKEAGVKLWPGGKNALVGLCPFHQDHAPSLWVNPLSGLWGCNKPDCVAAGTHDVINFRALRQGISNFAAIKQLADDMGRRG